jgi:hypothetical protein
MPATRYLCLIATLCLLQAGTAAAEITYGYGTVQLGQAQLTGSMRTTEAAIADGILTADELTADFVFSNPPAPFAPAQFTPSEFDDELLTIYGPELYVDRSSGEPYAQIAGWFATDDETGQRLFVSLPTVAVYLDHDMSAGLTAHVPLTVSGGGPGAGGGGPGGGPGDDITYAYSTTLPAGQGGTLSGSFVIPKAAIADGTIVFTDITAANFELSGATPPFASRTITLADFRPMFLSPGNTGQVRVNPVSGAFLHDFQITAVAPGTNQTTLELFPHRFVVWPETAAPPSARSRGQGNFTVSGGGGPTGSGATAVPVPALNAFALAALASMLTLLAARTRRAKQISHRAG